MTYFTTADLEQRGIGEHRRQRLVREGKIFRLIRGLYVDKPTPGAVADAVVHHYAGSVISGLTAAQLHLDVPLTLPIEAEGRTSASTETFSISHSRLPSRTTIRGLPVVEALWAARGAPAFAMQVLENHYSGRNARERLEADMKRMGKVPSWLRDTIKKTPIGSASNLERRVARPLLERGYHVELNRNIGPYCFDIVLPQWRIAIEIDSERYHLNPDSFISDRWKGNSGAIHGWIILRFTDTCVTLNLKEVLTEIEQAIAWVKRRRPRHDYKPGFPAAQQVWTWNRTVG
nr:type IV toxin-antitoxin system AbiEi family antitoxin domain-containing protein [Corynebacterium lactis]